MLRDATQTHRKKDVQLYRNLIAQNKWVRERACLILKGTTSIVGSACLILLLLHLYVTLYCCRCTICSQGSQVDQPFG